MTTTGWLGAGDEVLAAMITPAVLISASGTLVLSTSNRLGRVMDRIRKLAAEAEGLPPDGGGADETDKKALVAEQVHWLARRLRYLQRALMTFYAAIGLLVGSSLTVGLSTAANQALGWLPVGLALAGAAGLLVGAALLVLEVRAAFRSTQREIDIIRRIVGRRTNGSGNGGKPGGGG
ncbi:MAG: DUF2721 domain-containing protein [Isosphaera sp.]|nr:DUF2721 domain-containing protein [Isosphaera sp.]